MNRAFLSRLAACRMRSSAWDTPTQLCVWRVPCWPAFPLAPPLPSIASAAGRPALFGDFPGTMGGSDFPWSYIIGFRRLPSRCGPPARGRRTTRGSPGSRVDGFQACEGSLTTRGRTDARHGAPARVAFRSSLQRRHPGLKTFRGSIPCPPVPLSTLRRHPYGWLRMTRGRRDWLDLRRTALSSATTYRSPGAQRMFAASELPSAKTPWGDILSARRPGR